MDGAGRYKDAPILRTDRLKLRPYRLEDFDAFARYSASPRSIYTDGPISREQAWAQFTGGAGRWQIAGHGAWAVESLADGAHIGLVSLNTAISLPEPELGWILWDGFEGQGLAFEMAACARRFAFDELGWARLVSCIHKDNTRSIRLAERLGCVVDAEMTPPNADTDLIFRHLSKI